VDVSRVVVSALASIGSARRGLNFAKPGRAVVGRRPDATPGILWLSVAVPALFELTRLDYRLTTSQSCSGCTCESAAVLANRPLDRLDEPVGIPYCRLHSYL
jgi:hypothetical protein